MRHRMARASKFVRMSGLLNESSCRIGSYFRLLEDARRQATSDDTESTDVEDNKMESPRRGVLQ